MRRASSQAAISFATALIVESLVEGDCGLYCNKLFKCCVEEFIFMLLG